MAEVVWSARALSNLEEIRSYIERFDPIAASDMRDRLISLAESLTYAPERGRPTAGGARELVSVHPYMLRYRITGDTVAIVRIRHSRRRTTR